MGAPAGERLIRYIDGTERLIRYPSPVARPVLAAPSEDAGEADSWRICGEHDIGCSVVPSADFDISLPGSAPIDALWGEAPVPLQPGAQRHAAEHDQPAAGLSALPIEDALSSHSCAHSALPDSPAELLRFLQSDTFKQQQAEQQAHIRDSFTVMHECPWPVPKQLTLLATQQRGDEHPTMYTLPVAMRMVRPRAMQPDIGLASLVLNSPRCCSTLHGITGWRAT